MQALCTALAITALSVGQPVGGSIEGSWTGGFEGRTFIRLELRTVNGAMTGGISLGNIEVDQQGVVRRADTAPLELTPIFDVTLKGSTVTFFRKDGNDTDQFEMRVLGPADADLHVVWTDEDRKELAAAGVPLPKPIRLTRAAEPAAAVDERQARRGRAR